MDQEGSPSALVELRIRLYSSPMIFSPGAPRRRLAPSSCIEPKLEEFTARRLPLCESTRSASEDLGVESCPGPESVVLAEVAPDLARFGSPADPSDEDLELREGSRSSSPCSGSAPGIEALGR